MKQFSLAKNSKDLRQPRRGLAYALAGIIFSFAIPLVVSVSGNVLAQQQIQPGNRPGGIGQDSTKLAVVLGLEGQVPRNELLQALELDAKNPVTALPPAKLAQNALAWLLARGYYLAHIDTAEIRRQPREHVFLYVNSGAVPRLVGVAATIDSNLQDAIGVRELRRAHTPVAVQNAIDNLLDDLGEMGYVFARARIDSVTLANAENGTTEYRLKIHIVPGAPVVIDSIRVSGNTITRRNVIVRELPIRRGQVFRESLSDEVPRRLMRLGYFKSVRTPELLLNTTGGGELLVNIEEGNSNSFNGVAGYNPGTGNESGYLTGVLDLKFGNLLGTGRQVAARWEKRSRNTQELALRYREPWLLGYALDVETGFQQLIQDTLYVSREFDLRAEWPIIPRMYILGKISRSSITPDSIGTALLNIPNSGSIAAGLGLRYDSTDEPVNPRSGVYYYTLLETINKKVDAVPGISTSSAFRQKRLVADANLYVPALRFQAVAVGLHWRQVTSSEPIIPLTDQFRFGGATTLRGYREEAFRGSRVAWMNLEYRYLLSRRSRVFVFFDEGYFYRQEQNATDLVTREEFRHSYGLGVRMETRLGIVGVDFGLGEGDTLQQGKVHVSLVNTF